MKSPMSVRRRHVRVYITSRVKNLGKRQKALDASRRQWLASTVHADPFVRKALAGTAAIAVAKELKEKKELTAEQKAENAKKKAAKAAQREKQLKEEAAQKKIVEEQKAAEKKKRQEEARLEKEKKEVEREAKRIQAQKDIAEQQERERKQKEEQSKKSAELTAKEKAEKEAREAENKQKKAAEKERLKAEKEAAAKADKEKKERLEKEKAEKEAAAKAEKERIAKEKAEKEAAEKERKAKERAEKEAAEKAEKEKLAREKAEKEAAAKAEAERAAKEKAEKQAAEKERKEKEKAEKEAAAKAEKERLGKEKVSEWAASRLSRTQAEKEAAEAKKKKEEAELLEDEARVMQAKRAGEAGIRDDVAAFAAGQAEEEELIPRNNVQQLNAAATPAENGGSGKKKNKKNKKNSESHDDNTKTIDEAAKQEAYGQTVIAADENNVSLAAEPQNDAQIDSVLPDSTSGGKKNKKNKKSGKGGAHEESPKPEVAVSQLTAGQSECTVQNGSSKTGKDTEGVKEIDYDKLEANGAPASKKSNKRNAKGGRVVSNEGGPLTKEFASTAQSPPIQVPEVSSTHDPEPVTTVLHAQKELDAPPTNFAKEVRVLQQRQLMRLQLQVEKLVQDTLQKQYPEILVNDNEVKMTIEAQLLKLAEQPKQPVIEHKPLVLACDRLVISRPSTPSRERLYKLLPKDIIYCSNLMDKHGEDYAAMAKDETNVYKENPRSLQRKIRIFKESPHFAIYEQAKREGKSVAQVLEENPDY